uniref:ARS-binding protein 1 N-terminal domain-containing protein n=1 Tax=Plectus sambesii TaxID=2011161 RepID=A0A914XVB3_9BILA
MTASDTESLVQKPTGTNAKKKTTIIRELLSSYHEHQLNCRELSERFPLSNFNVANPKLSRGLSTDQGRACLTRSSKATTIPSVEKTSNWLLLLQQLQNILWIALIVAGSLNLTMYLLD